MDVCSLRAATLDGKLITFTVADAPMVLGNNSIVLLNHCFSPILRASTLDMGSDVGVYMGDVIREDGKDWFVDYVQGFEARTLDRTETKYLYEFEELRPYRVATDEERKKAKINRKRMKFKYHDKVFTMYDIIGVNSRKIITPNIFELVSVDEIRQSSLLRVGRRSIYFGDKYKGMTVVMCYGRICVQGEFGLCDLVTNHYIIKREES